MSADASAAHTRGVLFMLATTVLFGAQDGISRLLAERYEPAFFVMIRYWSFALFVLAMSARRPGGVRAAAKTNAPWLQVGRGLLLAAEIVVMMFAFKRLGLAETHAVFACYPLIIAAMSPWLLRERVDLAGWLAILAGFAGVLILIRPSAGVFDADALIPLLAAAMFAVYGVWTRLVGRVDAAKVSFFYTGVVGAVGMSVVGPFFWTPMDNWVDWAWLATLCVTGAAGHYCMISAYEATEAAALQPYAYLQLVWASLIGVAFFAETLTLKLVIGATIIVVSGLALIFWRRAQGAKRALDASRELA